MSINPDVEFKNCGFNTKISNIFISDIRVQKQSVLESKTNASQVLENGDSISTTLTREHVSLGPSSL